LNAGRAVTLCCTANSPSNAAAAGRRDDRVAYGEDFIRGETGAARVLAHRLGVRTLINTDGADGTVLFMGHVGSDPANAIGHFVEADSGGTAGGLFQLGWFGPTAAAENDLGVHVR
jgi:hypothetical protein